ncbi:MAG: hypothetical protein JO122_02120, partial [Acetobacteraceae bacterium]|nr:hypothetical protein [Acetobacteraceae bacterium]
GAPTALVAAGGVAANQAIREALIDLALQDQVPLVVPPPALCGDNAAMVAWAGAERLAHGLCDALDAAPRPRWPLAQVTKPENAGQRTKDGQRGLREVKTDCGSTQATRMMT